MNEGIKLRSKDELTQIFNRIITILIVSQILQLIVLISVHEIALPNEIPILSIFLTLNIISFCLHIGYITATLNKTKIPRKFSSLGLFTWIFILVNSILIFFFWGASTFRYDLNFGLVILYLPVYSEAEHVPIFSFLLFYNYPKMPIWMLIFSFLNIISAVLSVIFSSKMYLWSGVIGKKPKKIIYHTKNRSLLLIGGIGSIMFFFFTFFFIIRITIIGNQPSPFPIPFPIIVVSNRIYDFYTFKFWTFIFSILLIVGEVLMGVAILGYHKQYESKLAKTAFIFSLISSITLGIFFTMNIGFNYHFSLIIYLIYFGFPFLYTFFILISIGLLKIKKDTRFPTFTAITGIVNIITSIITIIGFFLSIFIIYYFRRGFFFGIGLFNFWVFSFGLLIYSCILIGITFFIGSTSKTVTYNQKTDKKVQKDRELKKTDEIKAQKKENKKEEPIEIEKKPLEKVKEKKSEKAKEKSYWEKIGERELDPDLFKEED